MTDSNPTPQRRALNDLTAEYVRSILNYDPETGAFTWRSRDDIAPHDARRWAGNPAGSFGARGYRYIKIWGRSYRASRLAHLYMTGEWPINEIDHRDLDRSNDRWQNLRQATGITNSQNRKRRADNTSGCKGVSFHTTKLKWAAYISINKRLLHIGYYDSFDDAKKARQLRAKTAYGEYNRE